MNRLAKEESGASLAQLYTLKSQQFLTKKSQENILNSASELDSEDGSKERKIANAFSALKTAMGWYEQQPECCPIQLLLPKRIGDIAAKKTKMYNGTAKNKWLFSTIKRGLSGQVANLDVVELWAGAPCRESPSPRVEVVRKLGEGSEVVVN
ncbi:hypothetical protein TNCV_3104671 [Trichonephila clavipes]|nr:hypothetical protein TNCV_3104671 [Trichonephila clavipes]